MYICPKSFGIQINKDLGVTGVEIYILWPIFTLFELNTV